VIANNDAYDLFVIGIVVYLLKASGTWTPARSHC
jgi:hypothetical protein